MKTLLTDKKWIILIIVLIVSWFLWFQLRPSLAISECQEISRESGANYFNNDFIANETPLKKSQLQQEHMENVFERCLHDKGIK